jgi:hypothetical protein
MTYILIECRKEKNTNNNDIIFLEVEITNDVETYRYAEWLLPEDVALILADDANINIITAQVVERGVLAH